MRRGHQREGARRFSVEAKVIVLEIRRKKGAGSARKGEEALLHGYG